MYIIFRGSGSKNSGVPLETIQNRQEAPVLVTFGRQLSNAFFYPDVERYRLVYK